MNRLGVNIDHIATVRQIRGGIEPEPVYAAMIARDSGADSIVVHLREDRRHIQDRDVFLIKQMVKAYLNLEMSIAPEIAGIACEVKPDRATLVPEKRKEVTTEGGLDAVTGFSKIKQTCRKLQSQGIDVSLFIEPKKKFIDAAVKLGVPMIELHTGRYADAVGDSKRDQALKEIMSAASYAKKKGLSVFAGHGLDYHNVSPVARIKEIEEFNIGYSIVCKSVVVGLAEAVRQMKKLINVK